MIIRGYYKSFIDIAPGRDLADLRDRYLVSALHFNNPNNVSEDVCGNEWIATGDVSVITDSEMAPYKNMCCLGNNSSLVLKTPIETETGTFIIDFWMKTKVVYYSNTTDWITDSDSRSSIIDKKIAVNIYDNKSNVLINGFYNGAYTRKGFLSSSATSGYAYYKNKNSETTAYTLISRDLDGLHHFAISYRIENNKNYRYDSIWVDGYPIEYEYTSDENILKYYELMIKFLNTHTEDEVYTPMYISNFRVWKNIYFDCARFKNLYFIDGYTSLRTDDEGLKVYNEYGFNNEIQELKDRKLKQMTKKNFLQNKTNGVCRNYIDDNGYKAKRPKLKEITTDDLIYLPFNDNTNLLKDLGSYGMTWKSNYTANYSYLKERMLQYKEYIDGYYNLNGGMEFIGNYHVENRGEVPSYSNTTLLVKECRGSIESSGDKFINFKDLETFTIEFFAFRNSIKNGQIITEYSASGRNKTEILETEYNILQESPVSCTVTNSDVTHIALVYDSQKLKKYINGILTESIDYIPNDENIKLILNYIDYQYFDTVVSTNISYINTQLNTTELVVSAGLGQFRIRNIAAYNGDFDPSQELFTDGSDIMDYLKSQKVLDESNSKILLLYPINNPQTIYDISYGNENIYFKPEYNTTKYVDYDLYNTLEEEQFPSDYVNFNPVFSGINNVEVNDIKFRINKFMEFDYVVECYIYINSNFSSDDYKDLLYISGINNFIGVQATANGSIKLIYHKSVRYSTETRTSVDSSECIEEVYAIGVQNKWNHFKFTCQNSEMIVEINESPISTISDYVSKYLHRIILCTGARRTGSITPYYLGLKVCKL